LATLAHFDLVSTIGQIHLVLITLIIRTKSLFQQLAVLKKIQISQNTTTKQNGSEKPHRHQNVYSKFDDLQLYALANYFFTVVNQDMGFTVAFILIPGFALDVTANYMVLQMYLINAVLVVVVKFI
jgi:Zn-dependent M28 family amino/carboxypeptidase